MSLSEDERHLLHEIEQEFKNADPRLARALSARALSTTALSATALSATAARRWAGVLWPAIRLLAGLSLVALGLLLAGSTGIVLAIGGYLMMVAAGAEVAVRLHRRRGSSPVGFRSFDEA